MNDRDERTIVYLAGVDWDAVPGTDRRLVSALPEQTRVLWVDPPISAARYFRALLRDRPWDIGLSSVAPSVARLRVLVVPGTSRPLIRDLISLFLSWRVKTAAAQCFQHSRVDAVVNASPEAAFPPGVRGRRLFYITDDWVDGAPMIGMDRRRVQDRMIKNAREADVIAAVTTGLAEVIGKRSDEVALLPNGCVVDDDAVMSPQGGKPADVPEGSVVGVVGQINERLDLSAVRAVADAGPEVIVVGPRTEREAATADAIDELFAHPNVHWVGAKEPRELPSYLAAMDVGITPYTDTAFNRRSSPLKTLEYLAAGLPVVSSDMPSVRQLNCEYVAIADDVGQFARLVIDQMASQTAAEQCIDFARRHTWAVRARRLVELLETATGADADGAAVLEQTLMTGKKEP